MGAACSKSEMLVEENNMLKNRITILETKDLMESGINTGGDSDIKEF